MSNGLMGNPTQHIEAPMAVRWVSKVLLELPAPTETWASIIGDLVWPLLILFLVFRFRHFIRTFLYTLAERVRTDHVKIGWFEIRPNDQLIVLDSEDAADSTEDYDPADIQLIERIFEFINEERNYDALVEWIEKTVDGGPDIEDFLTDPIYAGDRARAFDQVKGLEK